MRTIPRLNPTSPSLRALCGPFVWPAVRRSRIEDNRTHYNGLCSFKIRRDALEPRAINADAARHAIEEPRACRAASSQFAWKAVLVPCLIHRTSHALPWHRGELVPGRIHVTNTISLTL